MKKSLLIASGVTAIAAALGISGSALALNAEVSLHEPELAPSHSAKPASTQSSENGEAAEHTDTHGAENASSTAHSHANDNAAFLRESEPGSTSPAVPEQAQGHVDLNDVIPDAVPEVAHVPTEVPDPQHGR